MYTFDGRIRYSETDSSGRLTMLSLLNYFQDCSTFHSEDLGVGVEYLAQQHLVWVLSSWQIVVERFPRIGERVRIGTLPYEFKAFLGYRNFAMETTDGERLAVANSLWSLLNTDSGKPTQPPALMTERYVTEPRLEMDYAPRKIVRPEGGEDCEPVTVKPHHLDTNHHVNNGQYVAIAAEYLPKDFSVRQLRAEYKAQAHLGDILQVYRAATEDGCVISLNNADGKPYCVTEWKDREK